MTYSLAVKGAPAQNAQAPLSQTVDDSVARYGGAQNAMMLGTPFLCQGPDGAQAYYTYDAERSNPDIGLRILKRV